MAPLSNRSKSLTREQKFAAARQAIANSSRPGGSAVMQALHEFTQEERHAFAEWSLQRATPRLNAYAGIGQAHPLLDVESYTMALVNVDFGSTGSIKDFSNKAFGHQDRPGAQPIPLGNDSSFRYYLRSQTAVLRRKTAPSLVEADIHPYVVQMRNENANVRSPFEYGFCLGYLDVHFDSPDLPSTQHHHSSLQRTPFQVYLDPDGRFKSVWIVFDPHFEDELGNNIQFGDNPKVWDYLPSPQSDRPNFKVLRITNLDEMSDLSQHRNFFGGLSGNMWSGLRPETWSASFDEVRDVAKRSFSTI